MKRTLLTIMSVLLTAIVSLAISPQLACDKLFSEKNKTNPNVSITIINSTGNSFRSIRVEGDRKLVEEMERLLKEDRKRASNTVEKYRGGHAYKLILNISGDDGMVSIGFDRYSDSEAKLFISEPASGVSSEFEIEMPDGEGCGDRHVKRVLGSLLGNLDTVIAQVENSLGHTVYFVTDKDSVSSSITIDGEAFETD